MYWYHSVTEGKIQFPVAHFPQPHSAAAYLRIAGAHLKIKMHQQTLTLTTATTQKGKLLSSCFFDDVGYRAKRASKRTMKHHFVLFFALNEGGSFNSGTDHPEEEIKQ